MNIYLLLIMLFLIGEYVLSIVIERDNLNNLSTTLPSEFKDIYDENKYAKSQTYTKHLTYYSLVKSGIFLILTLGVIIFGGINKIDFIARSFGFNQMVTALLFFLLFYILIFLLGIPFSIYFTYHIEQKYGFNKTKISTFCFDKIKEFFLFTILMVLILLIVLYFFERFTQAAWLYSWIMLSLFSLFLTFIAPVTILPLFNKFTPLKEGELKDAITNYAKKEKIKLKNIFKIDGSKRSTKANAYFTGFGKTKRIALYDTLINQMNTKQIVAVLAHEVGHSKKGHIKKMIFMSIFSTGFMLFVLSSFINNPLLFEAFKVETLSIYVSFFLFTICYKPISFVIDIIGIIFSRRYEFEADNYCCSSLGEVHSLISALKILSVNNLSNLTPGKLKVFFQYSHPPVLKRIKSLRDFSKSL